MPNEQTTEEIPDEEPIAPEDENLKLAEQAEAQEISRPQTVLRNAYRGRR